MHVKWQNLLFLFLAIVVECVVIGTVVESPVYSLILSAVAGGVTGFLFAHAGYLIFRDD